MATRTISNIGGNYSVIGTWVEGAVPTSADTIVATSTSGNLIINTASNAGSVDFTNYTKNLSLAVNTTWGVYGNFTLASGMTISGTVTQLQILANSTLRANGKIWTSPLTDVAIGTATAITFSDTWVNNGNLSIGYGVRIPIVTVSSGITCNNITMGASYNGSPVTINGNVTCNGSFAGSSNFIMAGTGTLSTIASNQSLGNPITINTTGTTTIGPNLGLGVGAFTYTAGNVITTGSTLGLNGSTAIQTSGMSWNNIIIAASTNTNLQSNLNIYGTLTINGTTVTTFTGGTGQLNFYSGGTSVGSLYLNGVYTVLPSNDLNVLDLTISSNGTGTGVSGPSNINVNRNLTTAGSFRFPFFGNINMVGTGSVTTQLAVPLEFPFQINTLGTITFPSSSVLAVTPVLPGFRYGSFKYIAGTVVVQSGHTFQTTNLDSNYYPIDSGPIIWSNFILGIGSYGISIPSGGTVNIGNSFTTLAGISTAVAHISITGGTAAKLNLLPGATQSLEFVNATNIDSSGGQKILTYKGVLSNTSNWGVINPNGPTTIGSVF